MKANISSMINAGLVFAAYSAYRRKIVCVRV